MNCFRSISFLALTAGLLVLAFAFPSLAQRGHGMHPNMWGGSVERGGEWTYCPYCGNNLQNRDSYGQGSRGGFDQDHGDGRRFAPGYGMRGPEMRRPGMMGPGYPYGNRYPENQRPDSYSDPLKKQDAKNIVQDMLARSGNPNLKIGKVDEKDTLFVVEIVTKQGDVLVDRVQVDKQSGMMRSEYR